MVHLLSVFCIWLYDQTSIPGAQRHVGVIVGSKGYPVETPLGFYVYLTKHQRKGISLFNADDQRNQVWNTEASSEGPPYRAPCRVNRCI